jgi:syndecan 4
VDPDDDGDGVADVADPFPLDSSEWADDDNDGIGNNADDDDDNDGIPDVDDNCVLVPNPDQLDTNGDGEGDACQDDCDLDKVLNMEDICPCDPTKSVTDLHGLVTHEVGTTTDFQAAPSWVFSDGGKQINQQLNSRAGLAVNNAVFSSVRFTGVLFVQDETDDDVVGFLFGYQNHKNFYVVTSARNGSLQGNWKLTRVNSVTGHPSQELQNAIFTVSRVNIDARDDQSQSQSIPGQTEILWQHPTSGWKPFTPYSWLVEQRPGGKIFLKITEGSRVIVNETFKDVGGLAVGRVGIYTHSQENVVWSKMTTKCLYMLTRTLPIIT